MVQREKNGSKTGFLNCGDNFSKERNNIYDMWLTKKHRFLFFAHFFPFYTRDEFPYESQIVNKFKTEIREIEN